MAETAKAAVQQTKPLDPEAEAKRVAEEIRIRRGDIKYTEARLDFVGNKPGWTRRWCVDDAQNIPSRLADGWRMVRWDEVRTSDSVGYGNTDPGSAVSVVTSIGNGASVRQILMEIPTEICEEILEARVYSKNRAIEDSIRRGSIGDTGSGHRYNPGETQGSSFFGTKNAIGPK